MLDLGSRVLDISLCEQSQHHKEAADSRTSVFFSVVSDLKSSIRVFVNIVSVRFLQFINSSSLVVRNAFQGKRSEA